MSEWITMAEATSIARVHDSQIRKLARNGAIRQKEAPPGQYGHAGRCSVLVHRVDVMKYAQAKPVPKTAPKPPVIPCVGEMVTVKRACGMLGLQGPGRVRVTGKVFSVTKRFAVVQFPSGVREAFHFGDIRRARGAAS
jgi:hypothetical protein